MTVREWLTPEVIQALGIAITGVITAVTAWQARAVIRLRGEVSDLRRQVATVQDEAKAERGRFREAIRVIRALLGHIRELDLHFRRHAPDAPAPPPMPDIPPEIEEEI